VIFHVFINDCLMLVRRGLMLSQRYGLMLSRRKWFDAGSKKWFDACFNSRSKVQIVQCLVEGYYDLMLGQKVLFDSE
jgi:hypothetical protein